VVRVLCPIRARRLIAVLPLVAILPALAACGGSSGGAVATVTSTVTAPATTGASTSTDAVTGEPTPTGIDASAAAESPPDVSGPADTGGAASVTPSGPAIIRPVTSPRRLTLADVFSADGWQEGSISVPKLSTPVQGVYASTDFCGGQQRIELRFTEQRGQLRVTGAQALDSPTTSIVMEYRLLADGRLVDSKLVAFSQRQVLTADLTGVSSVVLEVRRGQGSTGRCRATAVLTDLTITPPPS